MFDLLSALQRLDSLLENAIAAAKTTYGTNIDTNPYRGLYLDREEVEQILLHPTGKPLLTPSSSLSLSSPSSPLSWLQKLLTYQISISIYY